MANNIDMDFAPSIDSDNDEFDVESLFEVDQVPEGKERTRTKEALQKFYDDYEYRSVPKIPPHKRGSDIIGLRTRATGNTDIPLGNIAPKTELRQIWDDLNPVEKLILMYISEHRHLTADQLRILIVEPTNIRRSKNGGTNVMKTYFKWVNDQRYGYHLDYKETHKTATVEGLNKKLYKLVSRGLLDEITPSYRVLDNDSPDYKDNPSLFTQHYYLSQLGGRVLVCNTKIGVKEVGYVPSHKNAAFTSIVHETETTEVLTSIISCAEYISNLYNMNPEEDENALLGADPDTFGFFDICRFYHEKDVEDKKIFWPINNKKPIDFKTDGKLTIYSSKLGDFIDYFIEYDSGSSKASNIKHKIEAFIKYILYYKNQYGDRFRRPVLLLVTQKPSSFIPEVNRKKTSTYTNAIKKMTASLFSDFGDSINDIACVLIADCNSLRRHGAMGACWHRMDLVSGCAEPHGIDLIEASKPVVQ